MYKSFVLILLGILVLASGCALPSKKLAMKNYVLITTDMGEMVLGLYESTPLHRDNFINNSKTGVYDSLLIHKATHKGLISAGHPDSKNAASEVVLDKIPVDTLLSPEIHKELMHRRGAVGAVRAEDKLNPSAKSHPTMFYIVFGERFSDNTLNKVESLRNVHVIRNYVDIYISEPGNEALRDSMNFYQQNRMSKDYARLYQQAAEKVKPRITADGITLFSLNKKQRQVYCTDGGLPTMDGDYTIFGHVVYGIDNLEAITRVKTGLGFRPRNNIYILSTRVMDKKEWKKFRKTHQP